MEYRDVSISGGALDAVLAEVDRIRRERNLALLFIGHDIAAVAALADRIAVMRAGRVVEEGEATRLLDHPVEDYTRTLLAAVP
ncbi:MAG: peptide ABC transporter permease, partial [Aquincola sp.]|nr:peptide ABC transporter permease [Aquincola sp.]